MKKKPKAKPKLYTFKATWTRKKNAQDATLRNVRAANKRFDKLEGKTNSYATAWDIEKLWLAIEKLELDREAEKIQLKKIMNYFQNFFVRRKK